MSKIKKLKDLIPDSRNANKGTVRGLKMIEASLQDDGFGRLQFEPSFLVPAS